MSVEMLKSNVLFKEFTPLGLEIISQITRIKVVLSGQPLFSEDEVATALYIVMEGRFRILVKGTDGRNITIASLGTGEHMGELALLARDNEALHLSTAIAESNSKVLEIVASDFWKLMKVKPQACTKLLLALAKELGEKWVDAQSVFKQLLLRAIVR